MMDDDQLEKDAVKEIMIEAKVNEELEQSSKALTLAQVASNPCINKRLYFKNLVSTLREPLDPKIVRKRKVAGLDCDLSEEEFIEKRKKWQSKKLVTGKDYDPDTDYIYDARKYYDPEKEQEAIEYRNKREAFLKMKQQKQEELQQQQQIQPPYLATNFKTQSDFYLASKPYLRNQGFAYRGGRFRGVHTFGGRFKRQRGFMPHMMGYYAGDRDGSYQNYESPYPTGLEYNSSNDAWLCGDDVNEPRCYSDVGGGENEDGVGYRRVGSNYRQDVPNQSDDEDGSGGGSGGGGSRERKKKIKKWSKKKSKKKHHHRKSDSKKCYNSDDGDDGRNPLLRGEDDVTDDADEDDEEEINLRQLRRELERKKLQLKQIFLKNSHSDGGGEEKEDERALRSSGPDFSTSSQHHRRHPHREGPSELHARGNSSDSYGTPETSPSEQRPADHKSASSDYKKHRHKPSKSPSLISSSSSSSRKSSAAAVPVEVDEKHASGRRPASSRDKMGRRKRKMTEKDKKMARNSSTNNNNSFSEISSDDGGSSCERANRRNFNENKLNPQLADDNNDDDDKCDDDDDEIKLLNEGKKLAEVIKRTEELLYGLGNCTSFTKIKQYARSYFLKTNIDEQLKVFLSRQIERSCSEVAYHSSSYIESQAASAGSAARSKDDIDVGTLENLYHQRHSGRPGGNFTKKYKINQVIKSRSGQNSNSSSRKSSPDVRKSRSHRRSRDTSQSNGSSTHSDDEDDDDDEEDDDQSKHETSQKSTAKKSTSTPYTTDDIKRKRKTQQQQSSADQSESSSSDESNSKNYHPPQRKENHSRTLKKYVNDHATGRKFENLQIRVTNSALMQASKTNNNNSNTRHDDDNNSFRYDDAGDQVYKPPPITRPHLLPDPVPYYLRGGGSGSFVGSGRSSNDGFYKFDGKVLEYGIGNNNSGERYFNSYRGAFYDGRRKFERADAIVSFKNSNYRNAIYEGNEFEPADGEQHFSSPHKLSSRHTSSTFYAHVDCDHADHYKQHYRAATPNRGHRNERTPTDHYPTSHRNYKNYSLTTTITTTTYPTSNEKNKLETLLSKNSMVADQLSPPPSSATNCSSSSRKSIYERLGRKLGDDASWNSRRPLVMKMPGPTNSATSSTFITPEYQNKYRTTRDEPLLPQFSRNLSRHDNLMRRQEAYQQHQHEQHRPNFKPYITNYAASSGFGAGSSRSSSSSNQPTKKFIHPLVHSSSSLFASSSCHFKRNLLSSSSSSPTTSSLTSSVRLPKASKSLQSAVSLVKR